jgi:hypothetical protein
MLVAPDAWDTMSRVWLRRYVGGVVVQATA